MVMRGSRINNCIKLAYMDISDLITLQICSFINSDLSLGQACPRSLRSSTCPLTAFLLAVELLDLSQADKSII